MSRMLRVPIPTFRSLNPKPVGVLFIVAMLTFLYFAFTLQNLPFIRGRSYTAAFGEAAGLRKGDKIRVAGLDVGQVDQVSLEGSHVRVRRKRTRGARARPLRGHPGASPPSRMGALRPLVAETVKPKAPRAGQPPGVTAGHNPP